MSAATHGGLVWQLRKAACDSASASDQTGWHKMWAWWVQLVCASLPPVNAADIRPRSRKEFVAKIALNVKPQLNFALCWQLDTNRRQRESYLKTRFDESYKVEGAPAVYMIAADVWNATVPAVIEEVYPCLEGLV